MTTSTITSGSPMKTKIKAAAIAVSFLGLGGCTTYSVQSIYPSYYGDEATKTGMPLGPTAVPIDLLAALPVEYQIAHYAGRLWCYVDWEAAAKVPRFSTVQVTLKRSDSFQHAVKAAIANPNREISQPVGFPHVACLRPAGPVENIFDEQWFAGWLLYLSEWDAVQFSIEERQKAIFAMHAQISDLNGAIVESDKQLKVLGERIAAATAEDKELDRKIGAARDEYEAVKAGNKVNFQQLNVAPLPPFNPKLEYKLARDPFADISAKYLKEVSGIKDAAGDNWATNEMEGGKFVDPELFEALERFHNEYLNPGTGTNPDVLSIIKELKDAGLKTIRIVSGVRSPYRQAHLVYAKDANENPVAQYVGSGHMFGQDVDIKFPKDDPAFKWGSPLHQKLRTLVTYYGLVFGVRHDSPHVGLTRLTRTMLDRRLAMMKEYASRAAAIRDGQHILSAAQGAIFSELKGQSELLSSDLNKRLKQIEEQTGIFGQMDAVLARKRQELEGWREKTWHERQEQKRRELERAEEERRSQAQAQAKADAAADRNSHRQSLGGDYGRAGDSPAPKSPPESPKAPKPSKQPPEYDCTGCGRIGKTPNS